MTDQPVKRSKLTKEELRRVEFEFFKTVSTLVISAFSLVAALAWNTTITKILETYLVKPGSGIVSWVLYAVIVTVLAVLVTYYVGQWAKRFTRPEETGDQKEKTA